MPDAHAIVLFDGVCNLCEGIVRFIIPRDKVGYFHFAALQSDLGATLLEKGGLPVKDFDSFVLIENGKYYTKSSAGLRLARRLSGGWKLLYVFMIVPKPLRDWVYSLVARNRYRIWGHKDSCMIPTPDIKARFLS